MTDEPGPTVIIPSLRCWRPQPHPPHIFGDPPGTRRCDGEGRTARQDPEPLDPPPPDDPT